MTDSSSAQKFNRLGLSFPERLTYCALGCVAFGSLLGGYPAGKLASLKYLAERAHRLPKTAKDWYYYHKWKNYRVIVASVYGTARYGSKLGCFMLSYITLEEMLDRLIGHTQMASSVISFFGIGMGFSLLKRLPKSSIQKACAFGILGGTGMGMSVDGYAWALGHPPAYVLWAQKRLASK